MEKHPDFEAFVAAQSRWQDEARELRRVLLACDLDEAIKWGKPCYAHQGENLAIFQPFKDFCALLFFKGALLDDPQGLLREQGANTRSAKRLCFTSATEIRAQEPAIRHLVAEAIAAEAEGRKLPEKPELELVEELAERLAGDPALKAAFEALTPGRQRAYHLYVSGAKQSKTRAARVEKHVARILAGKGLRDR